MIEVRIFTFQKSKWVVAGLSVNECLHFKNISDSDNLKVIMVITML